MASTFLSDDEKVTFRNAVMSKLNRLLEMPDASPEYKDFANCLFFGMIPDDPQQAAALIEMKAILDRNFKS